MGYTNIREGTVGRAVRKKEGRDVRGIKLS